jgi:hypothetical protein
MVDTLKDPSTLNKPVWESIWLLSLGSSGLWATEAASRPARALVETAECHEVMRSKIRFATFGSLGCPACQTERKARLRSQHRGEFGFHQPCWELAIPLVRNLVRRGKNRWQGTGISKLVNSQIFNLPRWEFWVSND